MAGRTGVRAAAALALGLLAARVVWHVFFSDLTLAADEAHYWEWSRRPGWSYYSKGPGVAWLIALSTGVFGHSEWAVRLPAAVSGAVGMLGAAMTARWAFPGRPGLPALAAALFALTPGFAVASMLMTIDAPYLACWAWGGAFAAAAILGPQGRPWAWLGLGACVGVGFLFKYTIVLLPVGVGLAWWVGGRRRVGGRERAGLAAGIAAAGLGLAPVVIWNASRGWPTVRHLLGHLGLPGGDTGPGGGWSPRWAMEYLGVQGPVVGGVLLLTALALWRTRRGAHRADDRARGAVRALVAMGVPVFVFYLLVGLRTRPEGNWAMAGACTWCVPAAWALAEGLRRGDWWARVAGGVTVLAGVLVIAAPAMLGFLSTRRVFGPYIPIDRVTGAREHAAGVAAELDRLRGAGAEPFVMATHYGRASLLAFYLPGRPTVWCASSVLGGRETQYDYWASTDLRRPETHAALEGRSAVLVGGGAWWRMFEDVQEIGPGPERRPWPTYVGVAYRGPPGGVRPAE